jgi:exodeoxyribonuclease V gamma subunit
MAAVAVVGPGPRKRVKGSVLSDSPLRSFDRIGVSAGTGPPLSKSRAALDGCSSGRHRSKPVLDVERVQPLHGGPSGERQCQCPPERPASLDTVSRLNGGWAHSKRSNDRRTGHRDAPANGHGDGEVPVCLAARAGDRARFAAECQTVRARSWDGRTGTAGALGTDVLTVHRAERADALIGRLADLLLTPPVDAFAPEVIAVPSKGVERWVMQRLSLQLGADGAGDGIAANIQFPTPGELVSAVMSTVAGIDANTDPWAVSQLVWSVLIVMDCCVAEPWCAMLAHHLGVDAAEDSHRAGRRYSTAATLARLFVDYGDNRPSMITDWVDERDTDGHGVALSPDMMWQAAFWRRLRAHIGAPSPAEGLARVCDGLRQQRDLVELPNRLSVFGPTRLTQTDLAVLEGLAAHRDVHLWLTHPSPAMWEALRARDPVTRRRDDSTALLLSNPLLANLSRDEREMQQILPAAYADVYHPPTAVRNSLLARIQDDVRHDRDPAATPPLPNDGSVAIHGCHGKVRQVEVLREALLRLFAEDTSLQPRDVIVLCPDVDGFAPLINAAFGQITAPHPGHRLRVSLADRGPARTNPLLDVVQVLLQLADGRVTASELLDLTATGPVARRFGFSSADQETIRRWSTDGGARWGIDHHQRELFGMGAIRQNTFATARDRLLIGVAADEAELAWLGLALPLDDVGSSDVDLAGRFAEFIERLNAVLTGLRDPQPAQRWSQLLEDGLELLTDVPESEAWQRAEASRRLGRATQSSSGAVLSLADVRALFADGFRPRPTRSHFRTGDVTVATLVPMRFVPHRVVAIIGLDDDAFPRHSSVSGDDVVALDPCLGERDPRSEDRQLLLDAVMSATDHLLLCFTGADPITGMPRPPSAPLADVIDVLAATVEGDGPVVTRQPLQPYDAANFVEPQPFSFDRDAYAAARAARRGPQPMPTFLAAPLPAPPDDEIALDDLVDFLTNPTKAFLKQRLAVWIPSSATDVSDALPLSMSGLPQWDIGDGLLAEVLSGATVEQARGAELRRGTLPPGRLGLEVVDDVADTVALMAAAVTAQAEGRPQTSRQVTLTLGDRRLTGTVNGVYGSTLIAATYSRLAAKHRVAAWVRLLALSADGDVDYGAAVIGRADYGDGARMSVLAAPPDPRTLLARLLDVWDAGMREPIPLGADTSCAFAARRASMSPDDAQDKAAKAWTATGEPPFRSRGENDDPAIQCVYGPDAPFSVVWDQPTPDSERWFDELNRFAQLALGVWGPLIEHETVRKI